MIEDRVYPDRDCRRVSYSALTMSDVIAKSPQADPEAQPLLDSPQVAYDTTEPSAEIVKQECSWKHILFYLLTTLLGVGILAIFIKGFIDADDVTVWVFTSRLAQSL